MLAATTLGRSIQTTTRTASALTTRANPATKFYSSVHSRRFFQTTSRKMGVHNIASKSEFDSTLSANSVVVVDFFATWCGPCKMISPQIVNYSNQYSGAKFLKVDVDEVSDVAAEYSIRAMPTFLIFKDGQKVEEIVGANPPVIEAAIAKYAS